MKSIASRFCRLFQLMAIVLAPYAAAEKTLTIESPQGQKQITLASDPEVVISYTPTGMKINFTNINMKVVCIEDPSADGLCRLQAYDGGGSGPVSTTPGDPGIPSGTAGDGEVALSWTAPTDTGGSDITGYLIEQAVSTNSPSFQTAVSNTGSSATNYTVTGLTNGTAYVFRVAGLNSAGTGSRSGYSSPLTPTAGNTTPPSSSYANACNGLSSNVSCYKAFNGDLATGGSATYVSIPNDKVLSIPFILESAASTPGIVGYQSFQGSGQSGYFFDAWFSSSANGPILNRLFNEALIGVSRIGSLSD